MSYYRRLQPDELEELTTDFVRFLAAQGIDGPTWVRLRTDEPERAASVIDEFSRFVYESTLDKIEYLELKTPNDIKTFHCTPEGMILYGLMVQGQNVPEVDFTKEFDLQRAQQAIVERGAQLKLYRSTKGYRPDRRSELFKMLENGCKISRDGALYKMLKGLQEN